MQRLWFDIITGAVGAIIWITLLLILGEERAKKVYPTTVKVMIGVAVCVCLIGIVAVVYLATRA